MSFSLTAPRPDLIPETSAHEEKEDKKWRSVFISGVERKIDVMVIEPYKKVCKLFIACSDLN